MWPALRAVIEGHTTLAEVCGEPPTIEDLELLERATEAHARGMREHSEKKGRK